MIPKKSGSLKQELLTVAPFLIVLFAAGLVGLVLLEHFGIKKLIQIVGYPGLFAIVYAESGLFFGFFLPGDSLLVTAGLLASQEYFKIEILLALLSLGAVAGDSTGYWFGKKVGPKIFKRENSLLFNKDHLLKAHKFYEKHGGKTIILARFVPFVRTFAPIVAGVAQMDYLKFLSFNIIGGIGWATGMLLIGFFLGNVIPNVDKYLLPLIALIIFLSILPGIVEVYKGNKKRLRELIKI